MGDISGAVAAGVLGSAIAGYGGAGVALGVEDATANTIGAGIFGGIETATGAAQPSGAAHATTIHRARVQSR